jgi:hypothetical protein
LDNGYITLSFEIIGIALAFKDCANVSPTGEVRSRKILSDVIWLREKGFGWTSRMYQTASTVDILEYAYTNGCPTNIQIIIVDDSYEKVKWLLDHNFSIDATNIIPRDIETLQLLYPGTKLSEWLIRSFIGMSRYDFLDYIYAHGGLKDRKIKSSCSVFQKWAKERGIQFVDTHGTIDIMSKIVD